MYCLDCLSRLKSNPDFFGVVGTGSAKLPVFAESRLSVIQPEISRVHGPCVAPRAQIDRSLLSGCDGCRLTLGSQIFRREQPLMARRFPVPASASAVRD